jgi:TonB family protein
MKLRTLPLVSLALLLGACSSFQNASHFARNPVPPAVRAENKVTTFGEFPSYQQEGQYFKLFVPRRDSEAALHGRAVVDVIVNADGTVQDAVIFESSGDRDLDQMAVRLYKNSRYSLRLSRGDPAPYVVRQEFVTRGSGYVNTADANASFGSGPPRQMGTGEKHAMDK